MNALTSSATPKVLKHHVRKLKYMMTELLSTSSNQVNNTIKKKDISLSTSKTCLHEWKCRGFTAKGKGLVTLKNINSRKTRLDFARNHLKETEQS